MIRLNVPKTLEIDKLGYEQNQVYQEPTMKQEVQYFWKAGTETLPGRLKTRYHEPKPEPGTKPEILQPKFLFE